MEGILMDNNILLREEELLNIYSLNDFISIFKDGNNYYYRGESSLHPSINSSL